MALFIENLCYVTFACIFALLSGGISPQYNHQVAPSGAGYQQPTNSSNQRHAPQNNFPLSPQLPNVGGSGAAHFNPGPVTQHPPPPSYHNNPFSRDDHSMNPNIRQPISSASNNSYYPHQGFYPPPGPHRNISDSSMHHNQYTNMQQPPSSVAGPSARQGIENNQHAETYHPSSAAITPTSGLSEPPPSRLLPQPPPTGFFVPDHSTPTHHQAAANSSGHAT